MNPISDWETSYSVPSTDMTLPAQASKTGNETAATARVAAVAENTLAAEQRENSGRSPSRAADSEGQRISQSLAFSIQTRKEEPSDQSTVEDSQDTCILTQLSGQRDRHKTKDELIRASGILQLLGISTDIKPIGTDDLPKSIDAANERFRSLTSERFNPVKEAFEQVKNAYQLRDDYPLVGFQLRIFLRFILASEFEEIVLAARKIRHLAEPTYNESLSHVSEVVDWTISMQLDLVAMVETYRNMYNLSRSLEFSALLSLAKDIYNLTTTYRPYSEL